MHALTDARIYTHGMHVNITPGMYFSLERKRIIVWIYVYGQYVRDGCVCVYPNMCVVYVEWTLFWIRERYTVNEAPELCDELAKCINERATIEKHYAKELKAFAERWQQKVIVRERSKAVERVRLRERERKRGRGEREQDQAPLHYRQLVSLWYHWSSHVRT